MARDIQAKLTTVGRPLRLEISIDGPWLERLKVVLRNMDVDDRSYPLGRYLEDLIEADIVYREAFASRGPFLPRGEIAHWLQQRHAGRAAPRASRGGARR